MFFLCITLTPLAMTVAVVNPSVVSIEDLLGPHARALPRSPLVLVAIDLAVVALLTALLGDALAQPRS